MAPSTILRWGFDHTGEFVRRWAPFEMAVGRSWRADETYIKVKGGWMFLYRAVDERGRTVASYLSRTRDQTAARNFFRQALKRHGDPRTITLDGFEPSHTALRLMGMRNEFNFRWDNPVKIRSCKYLNNIVEQDHRRVKSRLSAMLGFKSFHNARVVIAGIELIHKLKKGQYGVPSVSVSLLTTFGATFLLHSSGPSCNRTQANGFCTSYPGSSTIPPCTRGEIDPVPHSEFDPSLWPAFASSNRSRQS